MDGGGAGAESGLQPLSAAEFADRLPWAADLDLRPVSRWPTRLSQATVAAVVAAPLPRPPQPAVVADCSAAPRATIVLVTLDNLVFNRLCLESLLSTTEEAGCEVLVVDNSSTDGTAEYLRQLALRFPRLRVLWNDSNMGFAAANNQALSMARGERLVLLNNDTVLAPGWLDPLLAHLDDPQVGLVGPVTNRAGNEAQIETTYRTYGEFAEFSRQRSCRYRGQTTELRVATMFCAAMRRDVFSRVGRLDERFQLGLFEDDDYSMRVRDAGYRVLCAEDAFVHHFGQASIGKLAAEGRYGDLFHANRRRWEAKWQQPWKPYKMRANPAYDAAVAEIRQLVPRLLPPDARLLVVSKGDEAIVDLPGIRAEHFPQGPDGGYCGYNPADGAEAVRMLETMRAGGASHLLIPESAFWWLEHYAELRKHIQCRCTLVHHDACCMIVCLEGGGLSTSEVSTEASMMERK